MAKCPDCGKDGETLKTWFYGPKNKKAPHFKVTIFQCASGHKWRQYERQLN